MTTGNAVTRAWQVRGLRKGLAVLLLAYPLLVYVLLGRVGAGWLAAGLAMAAGLRLLWRRDALTWAVCVASLTVVALAGLGLSGTALKLYPAIVNGLLLMVFGASLLWPPSIVERLARLREPALSSQGVRYTRRVTLVWAAFFIVNGSIAAATALWGSDAQWALYNGLIAYVLMGLLAGSEWLLRQRLRARHTEHRE